ncbi:MAG: peptidylprolyl isomerase [Parcubacteria group bacterium Gr01-1014_3]|nr:MAG: peptidylprolyl isomerase [Parcubacteria group bacterium Gr01-1014_3]
MYKILGAVLVLGIIGIGAMFILNDNNTNPQSAENNNQPTMTQEEINKKVAEGKVAVVETNYGTFKFQFYGAEAPKTSENFKKLALNNFYDGLIFHRIIGGFMIQGGDPNGTGTGGPGYKFEDELNSQALAKQGYKKGIVAMANSGPNTNGSQFFVMLADYPLPYNYTIFGKVIEGQEVVDKIGKVQTGSGDRPVQPVVMQKVTIE